MNWSLRTPLTFRAIARFALASARSQRFRLPEGKPEEEPRTLAEFLSDDAPDLPAQNYPPEIEEQITAALTEAELCESFSSKKRGIDALELALRTPPRICA